MLTFISAPSPARRGIDEYVGRWRPCVVKVAPTLPVSPVVCFQEERVPIKTVPEILLLGPREASFEKNVVDEESQVFG